MEYHEYQNVELPVISFCTESTFFSAFYCYKNKSIGSQTCNKSKTRTNMFYSIDSQGWKLLEETDGCFVFGAKQTYKIAPRKQFVVFDFNLPPNKSVLIINYLTKKEYDSRREIIHISQINANLKVSNGIHEIKLGRRKISGLAAPYRSN